MLNMIKSNIYLGYTLGLESKKINPTELTLADRGRGYQF